MADYLEKAIYAFVLVVVGVSLLPTIFNQTAVAAASADATAAEKSIVPLIGLIFVVGLLVLTVKAMISGE